MHGRGDPWGDLPVRRDSHAWVGFVWILFPACGKPGWEDPYFWEVWVGDPWMGYGGEIPGNPGLEELGVGDPQEQVRDCSVGELGVVGSLCEGSLGG